MEEVLLEKSGSFPVPVQQILILPWKALGQEEIPMLRETERKPEAGVVRTPRR